MNRNKIIILALIALLIFISVQFFVLRIIWQQEDELLDLRYRTISRDAIDYYQGKGKATGFEDAYYYIDYFSSLILVKNNFNPSQITDSVDFKAKVLSNIEEILNKEEELSSFLKDYFRYNKIDTSFTHFIRINEFSISSGSVDYITITEEEVKSEAAASRIMVNHYVAEGNNFKISFDYFIDFTNKKEMVMRDIFAALLLGSISVLVVILLYLVTFRNLMEERRLSELKTDFINNMTHELKTPLSTITVAGKTLEMEKVRNDEVKLLETARLIGKQSIHLNQIINLILEISTWERREFDLELKRVEFDLLISEIVRSFIAGCSSCSNITENYGVPGVEIELDVLYFTTLVNNLLTNSFKYSLGEPEVVISTSEVEGGIALAIKDNGIGISREDQRHIFDKFYRVTHGNIHKTKGLGTGALLCKKNSRRT